MGKAGHALKQTLKRHGISQSRLASELGVERPVVFRWFHGQTDPTAETVGQIARALKAIDPMAANSFFNLYLGEFVTGNSLTENLSQFSESDKVSILPLSKIFDQNNNSFCSYKYILFLALLSILASRQFDVTYPVSFDELTSEMLVYAWIVHGYFKLSLGRGDLIACQLKNILAENNPTYLQTFHLNKKRLKSFLSNTDYSLLMEYTAHTGIYQLLYPFFAADLQGLNDIEVSQAICKLTSAQSNGPLSLYRLNANHIKECTAIIIAPDWADYIKTHFTVIKGWANWQWFQYMQAINPSTPNLINKLCATSNKNSLTLQTKFWKSVVNHHPLCCFYSGNDLDVKTLKLDYYLPWSFVAHDHLSNIVPISRSIDLFRSHHIPSDGYLQKFVDLQHLALTTNHQHLPKSEWHQVVMSYLNDLSLETEGDLLNHAKLLNAYKRTLHYLQSLAIKQGFKDGWHY